MGKIMDNLLTAPSEDRIIVIPEEFKKYIDDRINSELNLLVKEIHNYSMYEKSQTENVIKFIKENVLGILHKTVWEVSLYNGLLIPKDNFTFQTHSNYKKKLAKIVSDQFELARLVLIVQQLNLEALNSILRSEVHKNRKYSQSIIENSRVASNKTSEVVKPAPKDGKGKYPTKQSLYIAITSIDGWQQMSISSISKILGMTRNWLRDYLIAKQWEMPRGYSSKN